MPSLLEQGSDMPLRANHHSRTLTYAMHERECRRLPSCFAFKHRMRQPIASTPKHAPIGTEENTVRRLVLGSILQSKN